MSGYAEEIFSYMRTCPRLANLWSIGAVEEIDTSVIIPQGASEVYQIQEELDVLGTYEATFEPFPSVYEDYQINCYKFYDTKDSSSPNANINVMSLDEVQSVCDWIESQNNTGNLPNIKGVISVEANPFVPQVAYVNEQENIIAYFITLRVRYVNPRKRRVVVVENDGKD